jgi:hypothetical protein
VLSRDLDAACVYAISRISDAPSASTRIVKGSAVVVIGVGRRGAGDHSSAYWCLRAERYPLVASLRTLDCSSRRDRSRGWGSCQSQPTT